MFFISIFQIKKLLNKPVVRESCYYRKLTDRGKDEPIPSLNESQIENLTGELTWIFVAVTVSISVMRKLDSLLILEVSLKRFSGHVIGSFCR